MLSQRPSGVFADHAIRGGRMLPGTEAEAARVAEALSSERLEPYRRAAGGDTAAALRLYEWNLAVSGALYEVLAVLEVVLRNELSRQLEEHHGSRPGHWYDDPRGLLSAHARGDIAVARQRVSRLRRQETPGRIVAELSFGFWKFLLARRYEATLWTKHLRHAFPRLQPQDRGVVFRTVDGLHSLRNRIAHHEPVHRRNLDADAAAVFRLFSWIDADVNRWAHSLSRLQPLLRTRSRPSSPDLHAQDTARR
jgi:hypothetical protein